MIVKGKGFFGYGVKGLPLSVKLRIIQPVKKSSHYYWGKLTGGDIIELKYFLNSRGNGSTAVVELWKDGAKLDKGKATHVAKHLENFEFEIL